MSFNKLVLVKPVWLALFFPFCWLSLSACGQGEKLQEIDFSKKVAVTGNDNNQTKLQVGLGGIISPQKTYTYYGDLAKYLADKMGLTVEIKERNTGVELNNLIQNMEIDLAFVSAGAYIKGHTNFGLELLAAPQINGKSVIYSYIIVHKNSPINSLAQLKGHSFAFTDPYSNTGYMAPKSILAQIQEPAESFFGNVLFTYNHDHSIMDVAKGLVDGAAVNSMVWDYMQFTQSEYTSQTRIIQKIGPFGIPPVVVHPKLDPQLKQKLQSLILSVHENPEGKAILDKLNIERFVPVDDSAYDSIRQQKVVE